MLSYDLWVSMQRLVFFWCLRVASSDTVDSTGQCYFHLDTNRNFFFAVRQSCVEKHDMVMSLLESFFNNQSRQTWSSFSVSMEEVQRLILSQITSVLVSFLSRSEPRGWRAGTGRWSCLNCVSPPYQTMSCYSSEVNTTIPLSASGMAFKVKPKVEMWKGLFWLFWRFCMLEYHLQNGFFQSGEIWQICDTNIQ